MKKTISIILGLVISAIAITGSSSANAGTRSCMPTEGNVIYRCEDSDDEFCIMFTFQGDIQDEPNPEVQVVICSGPKLVVGKLK